MQKSFKFAVTVGRNGNADLEKLAQIWAEKFNVKYVERSSKGSLKFLLDREQVDALLVATNQGPQVYSASGTFFFHPSMAVLRAQRLKKHEPDHFVAALELKPGMKVLDFASFITGAEGVVCAVEASPLLHFVVSEGLQNYQAEDIDLNSAMRRITTVCAEAETYLAALPADSFDVVYFDPMFRIPVNGSSNMEPLRPLAWEKPLTAETVEAALRAAPCVVIKERGQKLLEAFGCTEIVGGRYSRVKYGIRRR